MWKVRERYRKFFQDLLPILLALFIACVYFLSVVPNTRPYWDRYVLLALVLLVLDRIFVTAYLRRSLLPPILAYKRGRRAGKRFTRPELEGFYRAFTSYVIRHQVMSGAAWAVAALTLATLTYLFLQRSAVAFFGILFTGAIAAGVSLGFSYFSLQRQTGPLIEEVQAQLERLPDVSRWRLSVRSKVGASVVLLTALAFLAFGVLVYSRISLGLADFAVRTGLEEAAPLLSGLETTPENEWSTLLQGVSSPLWCLVVVDAQGEVVASTPGEVRTPMVEAARLLAGPGPARTVLTNWGNVGVKSLPGGKIALLLPRKGGTGAILGGLTVTGGGFLLGTLLVLGTYTLWLSQETARTLSRTTKFGGRLASGDLREVPAIWSDDEMGSLADDLRETFRGLRKLIREVAGAASTVDEEVARTVEVVGGLHERVADQSRSAARTDEALKSLEGRILEVSRAMEQVSTSTQEVSSAILEMQASVEEIARNADVLIASVETTAASSNEIASSAQEVKGATERLHGSGQEAVSFLNELDASLEETRRNAAALRDAAAKVTRDAEAGFSAVAAVEDGILKTRQAGEESQRTLGDLMDSIHRIGRIVGVIQEVTEQTNLLSLNASIIAAGAGEYGKAFAVVAHEIRELSARTAANAKEIREVIARLTESGGEMAASMDRTVEVVDRSTELSREAGLALRTILESASTQEEMSRRIAAATEELAHGGQSASRAMQAIFEMIEGISRAAHEQAQSTLFLNQEAERVRDVARQLRNATGEQAKGSRVISEAVTRIMEDTAGTTRAVQVQTREAAAISEAAREVAETARAIERSFGDLSAAAGRLRQSAEILQREIRTFRT